MLLLGALSEIKNHPLQNWAKIQHSQKMARLDAIDQARRKQLDALKIKNETERKKGELEAKISQLLIELSLYKENPEKSAELYAELRGVTEEVGATAARLSVAVIDVEVSRGTLSNGNSDLSSTPVNRADAIKLLASKISSENIGSLFSESWRGNIAETMPFLAKAMQEFQIQDPRIAAVIIATIAVETPRFESYEEPQSSLNSVKQPFDRYMGRLGNIDPDDAAKFKGRGFLGLTGRANYAAMSQKLGLGTILIDTPEEAKRPEVAARIICAYFADRMSRVSEALDRKDLATVRRVVNGGAPLLQQFSAYYEKVLAKISI